MRVLSHVQYEMVKMALWCHVEFEIQKYELRERNKQPESVGDTRIVFSLGTRKKRPL